MNEEQPEHPLSKPGAYMQSNRFSVGSIELPGTGEPDFQALFRHLPGSFVATHQDFTIAAVSDDMRRKTYTWRQDITGRNFFEVFPDNPGDTHASGVQRLEASLREVALHGAPRSMPVLRYDMQDRLAGGGEWIEKFWSIVSRPVVDRKSSEVHYVLTEARDVTRLVQLSLWLDVDEHAVPELKKNVERVRLDALEQAPHPESIRARIVEEIAQRGTTPGVLVGELRALLCSPENRLYSCADEWVTESGVYVAYHRAGCVAARRVRYFAEGVRFPSCETCGSDVLYRLSHPLSR